MPGPIVDARCSEPCVVKVVRPVTGETPRPAVHGTSAKREDVQPIFVDEVNTLVDGLARNQDLIHRVPQVLDGCQIELPSKVECTRRLEQDEEANQGLSLFRAEAGAREVPSRH